jgi:Domain of unknown function (DUF1893)
MSCNHVGLEAMITGNEPTLTVLHEGQPIFTSYGTWLHPLFDLEEYLAAHPVQPDHLILQDKIIGKAAALLIHRLECRTVKAGILSRLGEAVLQRHGIAYPYEQLVDRIHCQTEELLADVEEESVQPFLAARAELFPSLFPTQDYPPNTLLIVNGLVREEFLVEIKAVAALP